MPRTEERYSGSDVRFLPLPFDVEPEVDACGVPPKPPKISSSALTREPLAWLEVADDAAAPVEAVFLILGVCASEGRRCG
jgi:hypothetical protein